MFGVSAGEVLFQMVGRVQVPYRMGGGGRPGASGVLCRGIPGGCCRSQLSLQWGQQQQQEGRASIVGG